MARLKDWGFLNPMPLVSLDLQRFFQLTHAIFYSCSLYPHQNLLIMPSISSQSPLGRRKQLIVYVGMAWATAFLRISLPPIDNIFSFHPDIFFCNFLLHFNKNLFFGLPNDGRQSKVMLCFESCVGSMISSISAFSSRGVIAKED